MSTIFPPFDPDNSPGRKRVRQLSQIPIRLILPNLVTLAALCAGLTAIRMAIKLPSAAIAAIAIAAFLDAFDGRVARLLKSTSRFGAELNSLTDFVNFGVAPGILLYVWALSDVRSLGWIAVLVFAICVALRLARFNVALDTPNKPEWQGSFFVGMPAPAGAMTVMLPIYMEFVGAPHGFWTAPVVLVYTLGIGLLMVSRVPTWSGKLIGRRIPRDMVLPTFVLFVLAAAFLVSFPWETITVLSLAYLATLPLSWNSWHQQMRTSEMRGAGTRQRDDEESDADER